MIDAGRYPYVEFGLTIGTRDLVDYAYADTGCEAGLLIPVGAGREILADPAPTDLRLPDGSIVEANSWTGRISLNGWESTVEVAALGDRYLLGREILDQLEVCFLYGREVRIRF